MSDAIDPARNASNGINHDEDARIRGRLFTAVTRGAAAGCVLRGGLTAFVSLLSFLAQKKRLSDRHPLEEILRMALFLGSLAGGYVLVDETIAAVFGKQRTSSWRGFLAGLCSGTSLLFLGKNARHDSLAVYILVRSLVLLIRCGNRLDRSRWLFALLAPTRMKYGDTALLTISAVQILYSYIMMPQTLPKSYRHFLDRHCGLQPYAVRALKVEPSSEVVAQRIVSCQEMVQHEKCRVGEAVDRLASLNGTGHVPFYSAIPCGLLHPNKTCTEQAMTVFPQAYARALSVYFPVYLAPALLVHRKKLLTDSHVVLPKVFLGVLRSSLFLSSFIAIAYAGSSQSALEGASTFFDVGQCTVHNLTGFTNQWTLLVGLCIPGLATLTEKKSRRMELALYSFARAAESFAHCLVEWGLIKPLKTRIDVILFSLSVAIITHCYSDDEGGHRHTFRSKYLNVLDFVFGNSGIDNGRIHHIPSNQDLIAMGSQWWTDGIVGRVLQFFRTEHLQR